MLTVLGGVARTLRRAGLQRPLRATRDAADTALLRLDRPPLRARVDGLELHGFLRHRSFLADVERDYEPTLRDLIVSSLDDGSVFVDVGAHIGFYSVLARRAGARVIAIEPDPYNRAALRRNLGLDGAQVIAAAVSDAAGTARFHPSSSTIGSSLLDRADIEMLGAITVPTTTVDALVPHGPEPLVLKIDVEGAEPAVLAGAHDALRRPARSVVVVEVNPAALGAGGAAISDVAAPLREAGYTLRFVEQGGRITDLPRSPTKGNIIGTRE